MTTKPMLSMLTPILVLAITSPAVRTSFAASKAEDSTTLLQHIEKGHGRYSKGVLSKDGAHSFQKKIKALEDRPAIFAPLMTADFSDKRKDREYRLFCFRALSKKRFLSHLKPNDFRRIRAVVEDSRDDTYVRIQAANLILRGHKNPSKEEMRAIKSMAFSLMKQNNSKGSIRRQVMSFMGGDSESEDLMMQELDREKDKNGTIQTLGKMKCSAALGKIVNLVKSSSDEKAFYRTRAYLAIGDIGGEEAYDHLLGFLKTERRPQEKRMIIMALGRTKSKRAKSFLVEHLQKGPAEDFSTVLHGLSLLGDPGVIPTLKTELEKTTDVFLKQRLQKTIESIESGDDSPHW